MDRAWDVVVVGAGLCGLTATYTLHQAGKPVCLVDSASHVGGVIQSFQSEGYQVEAGPTTFQSTARELLELSEELGLTPVSASPAAKKRYLYLNHQLQPLPDGPLGLIGTSILSPAAKLRLLAEPWQPKGSHSEPVADFIRRRLGGEILDKLVGPFISGIYAGDPESLDIAATFPKLKAWELESGSLLKGGFQAGKQAKKNRGNAPKQPYRLLSYPGGMADLPRAIASRLPDDSLRLGTFVERLDQSGEDFKISLSNGEVMTARRVVVATPADKAAELIETFSSSAAEILREIPYPPLFSVHVGLSRDQIPHPLDGFGFLIPRTEGIALLGSIWTGSLFPDRVPSGRVLLSCFIGGACSEEAGHWQESDALAAVLQGLRTVFNLRKDPVPEFSRVFGYRRAIPQYTLGHLERMAQVFQLLKSGVGPFLTGNYVQGVSLNDCVKQGRQVAGQVLLSLG